VVPGGHDTHADPSGLAPDGHPLLLHVTVGGMAFVVPGGVGVAG
jgi:hypothetical protein